MNETNSLLGLLTNCFPGYSLNALDLLLFSGMSMVLTLILLEFYKRVPSNKKLMPKDVYDQPLYKSKDILLQEKVGDHTIEYIPVKNSVSVRSKILLIIIALTVLYTPLYELLNLQYFI